MNIILFPRTVFIVEAEEALSQSLKCLLESHERAVRVFNQCEHFWAENIHRDNDIILLNFERGNFNGFNFLNRLMGAARRPKIVITTARNSIFKKTDQFSGSDVTILFNPVTPTDLVETIDRL